MKKIKNKLSSPKKTIYIIGIILLVIFLSFLVIARLKENGKNNLEIKSILLDKSEYGSLEDVLFKVTINSQKTEECEIKIKGIKPSQTYYIDISKEVKVVSGENNYELVAKTPRCTSGCGGVRPGEYEMIGEIICNRELKDNFNFKILLKN